MNTILETKKLTKSFGACIANQEIDFKLTKGTIHAIIGENGAGKTTFLKLLFGLYKATSGEIILNGKTVVWKGPIDAIKAGLGMLQQHFTLVEELSAIENLQLGFEIQDKLGRLDLEKSISVTEAKLPNNFLKIPWRAKVEDLTVSDKQKLEILKLIHQESEIYFFDEPTAVLAPQEVAAFGEFLKSLKKLGKTVVLITHKLKEVKDYCDEFTVLRAGKVVGSGKLENYTVHELAELMVGKKIVPEHKDRKPANKSLKVISAKALASTYETRGALKGVDFELFGGEILGIAGVEGSGQSQLVDVLLGLEDYRGSVSVFSQEIKKLSTQQIRDLGVGLIPEDRHHQGMWGQESCYLNLILGIENDFFKVGLQQDAKIKSETKIWADSYDVRYGSLDNPAQSLSGGNQQKLIFAREIAGRQSRLVIAHHPTRGVDLGAIAQIHAKLIDLRNQGMAVLLISSDLDELYALSDRICVLFDGKLRLEQNKENLDPSKIAEALAGAT